MYEVATRRERYDLVDEVFKKFKQCEYVFRVKGIFSEHLSSFVECLPDQHREVLRLLYGLGDGHRYPLSAVARIFEKKTGEVLSLERDAIEILRRVVMQRYRIEN